MEFDKRITDISKIMNCFTIEDAKKYLHTYGYFADNIEDFYNLEYLNINELTGIDEDSKYPYRNLDKQGYIFKYFLPCAFVADEEEKKEQKLRPYSINEFFDKFPMLSKITFREKGNNDCIITCVVNGYRTRLNGIDICLGVEWVSLGTLFNEYEYKNTLGDWLPFGVEK